MPARLPRVACCVTGRTGSSASARWNLPEGSNWLNPRRPSQSHAGKRLFLILVCFHIETNNPRPSGQASQRLSVCRHRPRSDRFRFQQGRQVLRYFFSRPLESVVRFWDDECPVPPCATHDALTIGIRLRLTPSVPSAAPAPPESVTPPTRLHPALALPKAEGTPVLL